MKFLLVGSFLFLAYTSINLVVTENFHSPEKRINSEEKENLSYPKKVNYMKKSSSKTPLKKIVDITEKFCDLPADDLLFIKELDKQFILHGAKVKIKVENNNDTETKNTKRTVEGELGYGFPHNGYQYNPPKFMFYPYSQQNIGSIAPNYFYRNAGKTEVSVEPSHSYELKSYINHNEPHTDVPNRKLQQHPQDFSIQEHIIQQQQQYEEPVIVLRIPGPAKYATHLQVLLQKYLEIRAAQYLHILEEAEQSKNQQQLQPQQLDYGRLNNVIPEGSIKHVEHRFPALISGQHEYPEDMSHIHQNTMTRQSVDHAEIDNVYNSYKNRHYAHHKHTKHHMIEAQPYNLQHQSEDALHIPQYEQELHKPEQEHHQYAQEQFHNKMRTEAHSELHYTPQHQYPQPEGLPPNTYHQVYLISMVPKERVNYEASQPELIQTQSVYIQHESNHKEHSSGLPIGENNPRPSHTKVIYTGKNDHTQDYQMYPLPSIKPSERRLPISTPDDHLDFRQQQQVLQNVQQEHVSPKNLDNDQQDYNHPDPANAKVVAITQRPYNYHAYGVKARSRGRAVYSSRTATTKHPFNDLQNIH